MQWNESCWKSTLLVLTDVFFSFGMVDLLMLCEDECGWVEGKRLLDRQEESTEKVVANRFSHTHTLSKCFIIIIFNVVLCHQLYFLLLLLLRVLVNTNPQVESNTAPSTSLHKDHGREVVVHAICMCNKGGG